MTQTFYLGYHVTHYYFFDHTHFITNKNKNGVQKCFWPTPIYYYYLGMFIALLVYLFPHFSPWKIIESCTFWNCPTFLCVYLSNNRGGNFDTFWKCMNVYSMYLIFQAHVRFDFSICDIVYMVLLQQNLTLKTYFGKI